VCAFNSQAENTNSADAFSSGLLLHLWVVALICVALVCVDVICVDVIFVAVVCVILI